MWGRYARTGQSAVTLKLPMNRLDIADHLGLTIETVCRTLTRLDREGCIRIVPGCAPHRSRQARPAVGTLTFGIAPDLLPGLLSRRVETDGVGKRG
ncbi:helix-turn-helix domain-containing protein [Methylobacterium oryzae CBMB20]